VTGLRQNGPKMNKRKLEEEIFQQNKFEKLNNIADSEDDDDDDTVDENNYDVMQEQDIEGNVHLMFSMLTRNIMPDLCVAYSVGDNILIIRVATCA